MRTIATLTSLADTSVLTPRAVRTALLFLILVVVLALVLMRILGRKAAAESKAPEPTRRGPLPDCPRCEMKLMDVDAAAGRLAFRCPVCSILYVAKEDTATVGDFPDGFTEEADWSGDGDPTTDGTWFGM